VSDRGRTYDIGNALDIAQLLYGACGLAVERACQAETRQVQRKQEDYGKRTW